MSEWMEIALIAFGGGVLGGLYDIAQSARQINRNLARAILKAQYPDDEP